MISVHLAEKHSQVKKIILLAPAFEFLSHWLSKLGEEAVQNWQVNKYLPVYHHAEKRTLPLSYNFLTDAAQYQEKNLQRSIPTLILHGKQDEVIPIQASRNFAELRPWVELIELNSDHALGNVTAEIWEATRSFCHERSPTS